MLFAKKLLATLTKLPGVGPRAAQRIALFLIKNTSLAHEVIEALAQACTETFTCQKCYTLDTQNPCSICSSKTRNFGVICVVESIEDVWAIERTQEFQGTYHVLHGNLSAKFVEKTMQSINHLCERVQNAQTQEIILALNSTFDGQTTSHMILKKLESTSIQISQIAQGIPLGSELDYMDRDTLTLALKSRRHFR